MHSARWRARGLRMPSPYVRPCLLRIGSQPYASLPHRGHRIHRRQAWRRSCASGATTWSRWCARPTRPEHCATRAASSSQGDLSDTDAIRRGLEGTRRRHPRGGDLQGRDPEEGAPGRCTSRTCAAPSACSTRRSTAGVRQDRLRLDRQRVRQHQGAGGRRELPARRERRVPLLLRRDQVQVAPDREGPDREGRADRDRAARRRVRPRRPLGARQLHRPDAHRQAAREDVPAARAQPRLRGRRRRRGSCSR